MDKEQATDERSTTDIMLALAERFVVAIESIAVALAPHIAEYEELEPDRDDNTINPEIVATMERMEADGIAIPDEVYKEWGIEPPDREMKAIDESTFDLPQPQPKSPSAPEPDAISLKPAYGQRDKS